MNIVKAICIGCWEKPAEAWSVVIIVAGIAASVVLGCVIFAFVGLYERIDEWNRIRHLKG